STEISCQGLRTEWTALDTNTSGSPNASAVRSTMAVTDPGSDTSAGTTIARPPSEAIRATTSAAMVSHRSPGRVLTVTAAPSRANATAVAAPIPREAPVTIATLSSRRPMIPPGRSVGPTVTGRPHTVVLDYRRSAAADRTDIELVV